MLSSAEWTHRNQKVASIPVWVILKRCRKCPKIYVHLLHLRHTFLFRQFLRNYYGCENSNTSLGPLWPANIVPSMGSNTPKTTQKGAWMGIFKPNSQYSKTSILSKLLHRLQRNFAHWRRPINTLIGCWNTLKSNPIWRTSAISKIKNGHISSTGFDRSARNLALWCTLTLRSRLAVNISNI